LALLSCNASLSFFSLYAIKFIIIIIIFFTELLFTLLKTISLSRASRHLGHAITPFRFV